MSHKITLKSRCHHSDAIANYLSQQWKCFSHELVYQTDFIFNTNQGYLTLRKQKADAKLIHYCRDDQVFAHSLTYHCEPVLDVAKMKSQLEGVFAKQGVLKKRRDLFIFNNIEIHLDHVEHLGTFLEIEVTMNGGCNEEQAIEIIYDWGKKLDVQPNTLLSGTYADLVYSRGRRVLKPTISFKEMHENKSTKSIDVFL